MDKKEFLDVSREYFKKLGFQILKKSRYYYFADELAIQVWLQHSDYSELYYINYDIQIKALHPNEKCDGNVCDVRSRLAADFEERFLGDFLSWNTDEYLTALDNASNKKIVPIMKQGVEYVKKFVKDCETMKEWGLYAKNNLKRILSL